MVKLGIVADTSMVIPCSIKRGDDGICVSTPTGNPMFEIKKDTLDHMLPVVQATILAEVKIGEGSVISRFRFFQLCNSQL